MMVKARAKKEGKQVSEVKQRIITPAMIGKVSPFCSFYLPILFIPLDRVFKFLASNYGSLSGTKFKETMDNSYDNQMNLTEEGIGKLKQIFNTILIKEIARTYKIPSEVSI
jgi:hypothetical protein